MSSELTANESFDRLFLLKGIDERLTRNGKPYLALVLGTPSTDLEARVWDMDMKSLPGLAEGDPVRVKGTSQLYQEKLQLIVDSIEKAGTPVDPREIYPSSDRPERELVDEFTNLTRGIENRHLAALMNAMKEDKEIFNAFLVSPAAVTMHHARIGGLAEHTLDVCRIVLAVSGIRPELDRDLLVAGAILHDIGKIREYHAAGDFRYTLDGKFVGHIIRGVLIAENWIRNLPSFPERLALELLHIILSHHGTLEHGSPRAPVTAEALVVHYADDLDAKLDMVRTARTGEEIQEAYVRGMRQMFQYRSQESGDRSREFGSEGEEKSESRIQNTESRKKPSDNTQKRRSHKKTEDLRGAIGDQKDDNFDEADEEDDQGELF